MWEALNLAWSKQQPTAPKRFSTGGKKLYDPPRNRYTVRDNADCRSGPNDRRADFENSDAEIRKRLGSSVFLGDSNSNGPFDLNTCMAMSDHKNLPQDDRWGEQLVVPTNVNCVENGVGFDHYEPHDNGKELDGRQQESPPALLPSDGADQMFEKMTQCDKDPCASRNRQRPTDRGDSSKKRNTRDHSEGAKSLSPSSFHSDYTSSRSRSCSRTLRSLFESPSPSKSNLVPSEKVSGYPSLRSSPSCHSGTKTFDSRSRSRSKSMSVSKCHNSSLLPLENDSKDYVENVVGVVCSKDLKKSEKVTSAVENELETRPAKLGQEEDTEKDISETDDEDFAGEHILLETRPAKLGQEEDTKKDISKTDDEDFAGEHILVAEADISIRSKISSKEMCMVLKHYGLQCPDEKEMDLPVETYFGSARLWPWEMVYYRRLKRGSISSENYSRRVAQNQEFGIVDKNIRGSSGWGELN